MRAAAIEEGISEACLQRMNTRQVDVKVGPMCTCMRSGSSPSGGEALEACAVRQLPSRTWGLDATLACSFGSSRLSNSLIGIF